MNSEIVPNKKFFRELDMIDSDEEFEGEEKKDDNGNSTGNYTKHIDNLKPIDIFLNLPKK